MNTEDKQCYLRMDQLHQVSKNLNAHQSSLSRQIFRFQFPSYLLYNTVAYNHRDLNTY